MSTEDKHFHAPNSAASACGEMEKLSARVRPALARGTVTITIESSTNSATTFVSYELIWTRIGHATNVHYCVLFCSRVRVRIG